MVPRGKVHPARRVPDLQRPAAPIVSIYRGAGFNGLQCIQELFKLLGRLQVQLYLDIVGAAYRDLAVRTEEIERGIGAIFKVAWIDRLVYHRSDFTGCVLLAGRVVLVTFHIGQSFLVKGLRVTE